MKNFKRMLAFICALSLVIGMLAGCSGGDENPTDASTEGPKSDVIVGQSTTYTITLQSAGGLPLSGISVYAYADEALTDLLGWGSQTDADGKTTITMTGVEKFYLVLNGIVTVGGVKKDYLEGYDVAASYPVTMTDTTIGLTSHVIADTDLTGISYELGSVMHDFTVTASNDQTYTLSQLLKEKDAVVLNFWYTGCTYCVEEFPYLDAVYQNFSENVEVLALDDSSTDNAAAVKNFCDYFYEDYDTDEETTGGLSFPMAYEDQGIGDAFNLSGYPTTVVIDRYGVVCFIYAGGIPSDTYWTYVFEAFIGDDYTQTIYSGMEDLVPAVYPTEEMPSSEEIAAVLNGSDLDVRYAGEEGTDDAELSWPFLIGEKDGVSCVYPSNSNVDSSYATMYAFITLEAGDVLAFDYYASSESNADVLYILVDRDDVYQISGQSTGWKTCYTWVAEESKEYEIAFCYLKDYSDTEGDDTVYVSNLRVVGVEDIDVATYIPRQCATNLKADGFGYENYVDVVYNEQDGYYHVGNANGPLVLANMMMPSQFSNDEVYTLVYNYGAEHLNTSNEPTFIVDGVDYYDAIINYCSYASNSQITSYVAVTQELKELLQMVADMFGVEQTENEWLQMCSYYNAYGTGGVEMGDPAAGLAPHNAYTAVLGENSVTYNRIIMPRGMFYKFVPTKSGVYRISSHSDTYVDGWIFTRSDIENRDPFYTYWFNERAWDDPMNVSMVVYLEAGKEYFIDVAFYDVYGTGTIDFTIAYEGSQKDILLLASPGYYTYYDETTYEIVAGGINVALGDDGYYHELLANGSLGSKLYVDMVSYSTVFESHSLLDLIASGAFNFAITDDDQWVLDYYDYFEERDFNGTDFETCMKEVWGENFEANWEELEVEDVLDGYYHGTGKDMTDVVTKYANKIATSGELAGCVAVNEELGEVLQMLMDKYSFSGVENSWIKLCYYYDYLGPDPNK